MLEIKMVAVDCCATSEWDS